MKLGANGNLETGENGPSKVAIIKPPPLLVMAGPRGPFLQVYHAESRFVGEM
jgi:hypothetical protein